MSNLYKDNQSYNSADRKFHTLKAIKLWIEQNDYKSIKKACGEIYRGARQRHQDLGFPMSGEDNFYKYVLKYAKRIGYDLSIE